MNFDQNHIDLLINKSKIKSNAKNKRTNDPSYQSRLDDNDEIMNLLEDRLTLGRQRYGHGMIVDQDTTIHGTKENNWELMALEELLDGLIYTTAALIRHRRERKENLPKKVQDDGQIRYKC